MTRFNFGDIVLVPFPFTNQQSTKKRPATVISSSAYNQSRPDLILMALTSNVTGDSAPMARWKEAGLPLQTAIKPVLATVEAGLILKKIGHMADEDISLLKKVISESIGS